MSRAALPERVVRATYSPEPGSPAYHGNPLVEALPSPYAPEEVLRLLEYWPDRHSGVSRLPPYVRVHHLEQGMRFFVPLPIHVDLQGRIDRMLRNGYTDRNPMDPRWRQEMTQRAKLLGPSGADLPELWVEEDTTSTGLIVIGSSGMGKTRSIRRVLRLYPQVIRHIGYRRRRDFLETQIVHLKVDCPHNGSLLALITDMFQSIDRLAGTNHSANYIRGGRTAEALLPYLAHVALLHDLGMLVVDEVQDLSAAGVGYAQILNFFVKLSNVVRIPIVLIGTPAATRILSGEFRQTRRGSSQGELIWDRMARGSVWDLFCTALGRYQYTRTPHSLLGPLGDALHHLSDGILDTAVAIYKRAQVRVIEGGGDEVLDVEDLARAAEEDFQQVQEAIRTRRRGALNVGREPQVTDIDDVRPLFGAPQAVAHAPLAEINATLRKTEHAPITSSTSPSAQPSRRAKSTRRPAPGGRGLLPSLAVAAATERVTLYEALRNAGLVSSALAYLDGSVAK